MNICNRELNKIFGKVIQNTNWLSIETGVMKSILKGGKQNRIEICRERTLQIKYHLVVKRQNGEIVVLETH